MSNNLKPWLVTPKFYNAIASKFARFEYVFVMGEKKKKVYIITFHHVLNNGGVLQAYALSKYLKCNHFDVEIIDYKPWYFMLQTYRPAKGVKKSLSKLRKIMSFGAFRKKLPITNKSFYSRRSLSTIDDASTVICGSDQIWNAKLTGEKVDLSFYLAFLGADVNKIAYAASSGGNALSVDWELTEELVKSFSFVGLRENSTYLELTKLAPELAMSVVLDPSLLIHDYSEILNDGRVPKGKYLLTYVVGSGKSLEEFDKYIEKVKVLYGLPVVHIGAKKIESSDMYIESVGPEEWVAFFKSSARVITNSFHGTAFSINFRKQFSFFPNSDEGLNERQATLLNSLGLESRRVKLEEVECSLVDRDIDYTKVSARLEKLVGESQRILLENVR